MNNAFSKARDDILEVLQHDGDWLSFPEIQKRADVASKDAINEALAELIGYQHIQARGHDDLAEWKAIMEPVRR